MEDIAAFTFWTVLSERSQSPEDTQVACVETCAERTETPCYGLICVSQNSYVEVVTPPSVPRSPNSTPRTQKVTVFGDKTLKEVIKFNQGNQGGP